MNSYERFFAVLNKKEPDILPTMELEVEKSVMNAIYPGVDLYSFYKNIDLDAIVVFEDIPWQRVNTYVKRDHFGVLRDFKDLDGPSWPFPCEPLIKEKQDLGKFLEDYKAPDPHDPKRLHTFKKIVKRFKGEKAIVFGMHSSFIYVSFIRGFENLLMDYIENPEFAKKLTKIVVDYFTELTKEALDLGADAIIDCEDYCGKNGPFLSREHFKEFILPGLLQIIDVAKEKNIPVLKHSDGYLWPILDLLVNAGISALQAIEPAAGMDIGEVKRVYGELITVIGNVDCSQLLTFGSPKDVKQATMECIKKASIGGGHILSSSNVIHKGVPSKNFLTMIKTAREYGKYPIDINNLK